MRASILLSLAAVSCGVIPGFAAPPEAPPVTPLRAKLAELVKRNPSAYASCDVELALAPLGTAHSTLEVWARDRQHYRAEDTHGSVVVVTPEAMKLYNAPSGTMLRIPAETVPGLEPKYGSLLALLGLATPKAATALLEQFSGELTPTGEATVAEVPCLTFSAGPKGKEMGRDLVGLFCSGPWTVEVKLFDVFLERETELPRGMHLDASLTSPQGFAVTLTLDLTVRERELDVNVTDDMLTFDPPAEETDIIEWTPETPIDEVSTFMMDLVFSIVRGGGQNLVP
ncbi:MAG: hypothetical protein FJX75_07375 [Armatimonadetes bacterium]|nr:hypothetical protein [Armatimonadota bacterium]